MKQGRAYLLIISRAATFVLIIALLTISVTALSAQKASASSHAATGTIGGCQMFPSNNVWNYNISNLPVSQNSANYIASIGLNGHLHADFGSGLYEGAPIGIPYVVVPGSQPSVPISFDYSDESDPGPYPIPANAPIEGGAQSTGDRHVLIVDSGTCKLYEVYSGYPQKNGSRQAGSGAFWNLNSNALRPSTWTSADAAGLPILPGLVSYDEIVTGVIKHALRFTVSQTQDTFLWPARHAASSSHNTNLPPMGLRLRLKASVNISSFSRTDQIILTALKQYGMFVADNGSSWYISGAPDDRWNNDSLHALSSIPGSDFEAVDESSLEVNKNSGQVNNAPVSATSPTPLTSPTHPSAIMFGVTPLSQVADTTKEVHATSSNATNNGNSTRNILLLIAVVLMLALAAGIVFMRKRKMRRDINHVGNKIY